PYGITLSAPLAPNINHRDSAFGGSLAALATLAAWSLVHTRLVSVGITSRLVIQRNTMEFETPACDEFVAVSSFVSEDEWPRLLRMLERRGKGRIAVRSELRCAGEIAGRFEGDFVALDGRSR